MQSVIQKKSYDSVKVFWLNKELLESKINAAVKRLTAECQEVMTVILFGSVAEDKATVSSDIDILIVVKESKYRFIDRPLQFGKYFEGIGLGVDIFVYTSQELRNNTIPLAKSAFKKGKILFVSPTKE